MKAKHFLILIIFFLPVVAYIIFRKEIKAFWEDIDILISVSTYSLSAILLLYNINLKFHFTINRVINWFKQDYTFWNFSYSFETEDDINEKELSEIFSTQNFKINKKYSDFLEVIYKDNYIFRVSIIRDDDVKTLHLSSSKLTVPQKRVIQTTYEITEIAECLENRVRSVTETKRFDLSVEYPVSSPFYNYWLRNLPEQSIISFNVGIKIPTNENLLKVDKNKIVITSNSLAKLFDTTKDYLSLSIEI